MKLRQLQEQLARHGAALIVAVAVSITLPSLGLGLFTDDIWQRRFLLDHVSGVRRDPWWNLFGVPLTPEMLRALVHGGYLPWWTSPRFQLSFFRPLAVATHFVDYLLWPNTPWLMHLQNTLFYALSCLAMLAVYRRALGGRTALLAGLLYAIDEAHLEAVAWVSARNSLLTALFCALTLLWLDEQRKSGSPRAAAGAALSLALAHLSSEGAIAVWAYILAFALLLPRKELPRALFGLTPCAAVSVTYALLTAHFGYTVAGGGAYIDPRVRPGLFAQAVLERLPRLLGEQFGPPAWLWRVIEPGPLARPFIALSVLVWLALGLVALRRASHRRELAALLAGALGSALVVCAARPEPRLLLMVGLGAHAFSAELVASCVRALPGSVGLRRLGWLSGIAWIGLFQLALAPIGSLTVPAFYREQHRALSAAAAHMQLVPEDAQRVVLLLNSRSYFDALAIATYRLEAGPRPWLALHILGSCEQPVTLTRSAPDRLLLEPQLGYLLERTSQQARAPDERFVAGQTISLVGLNVVVESITDSGRPKRVRLELEPDYARRMRILNWNEEHHTFERFALPPVGARVPL